MLPSRTSHSGRNGNFCEISRILIGFALGLLRKGAPDIFNKARWSARNGRGINRPLAVTAIGDRLRAWRLTSCLTPLCDSIFAVDISTEALEKARERVDDRPGVTLAQMAFP